MVKVRTQQIAEKEPHRATQMIQLETVSVIHTHSIFATLQIKGHM